MVLGMEGIEKNIPNRQFYLISKESAVSYYLRSLLKIAEEVFSLMDNYLSFLGRGFTKFSPLKGKIFNLNYLIINSSVSY
ncbi:MAG: hypothetical protein F6K18_26860 [Okeania sp. SIO2C2]|uniref:hypothetical protein n=1 Tax=Okeania sp. SIO2C2 TaxID=2607787 RepID=UPI0013BDA7AC|nr:hypothetical protein [Okeania sp. SIO2C2]NEP90152.1 hypothetical protein [Okeania sp. SIO2C2]